uniref:NADH-ubiquinone oxidoreductase chain 5 n=1 Tax=Mayetiola destructor TaxID=39758 RepID=C7FIJ8_MAYDE|nr:NADH dehydrogenase subunit 5 [Mayetiola destructor]
MYFYIFYLLFFISLTLFSTFLFFIFYDLSIFFEWIIIELNSSTLSLFFLFDWMSLLFMSFVLFISSMVTFYSMDYMNMDTNKNRFLYLVFMFIISMMFLIMCPNLITILIGWDGLGLVSYCLVIYFQNYKSYNAGMLTSLSNRIGDIAILISIAWMLNMGGWNFFFYLDFFFINNLFFIMVILAAMTKSAQIPFSAWLPAAMAAPTPVSALVHSSTLVTAGVYLLIRFYSFFFLYKNFMFFLLLIGCLTMFMSGLGANFEMDLKKIIALSTLSQLGLMMGILSLSFEKLAFYHLLTHALFKSLLFLCAGLFIHSMMNFQDVRLTGGINMFFSLISFNVSSLALCGMPFLAGFYSKDLILEFVLMSNINIIIIFFFFSTGLTVIYSFRLIFFLLMNFMGFMIINMSENMVMIYSMISLLLLSIIGGSLLSWLIFPYFNLIFLNLMLKILTLLTCFLSVILSVILNLDFLSVFKIYLIKIKYFISLMWFMPIIFSFFFNFIFLKLFNHYKLYNDMGWMEYYGGKMFKMLIYVMLKMTFLINYFYFLKLLFIILLLYYMI